jgi:hypothetical protein
MGWASASRWGPWGLDRPVVAGRLNGCPGRADGCPGRVGGWPTGWRPPGRGPGPTREASGATDRATPGEGRAGPGTAAPDRLIPGRAAIGRPPGGRLATGALGAGPDPGRVAGGRRHSTAGPWPPPLPRAVGARGGGGGGAICRGRRIGAGSGRRGWCADVTGEVAGRSSDVRPGLAPSSAPTGPRPGMAWSAPTGRRPPWPGPAGPEGLTGPEGLERLGSIPPAGCGRTLATSAGTASATVSSMVAETTAANRGRGAGRSGSSAISRVTSIPPVPPRRRCSRPGRNVCKRLIDPYPLLDVDG